MSGEKICSTDHEDLIIGDPSKFKDRRHPLFDLTPTSGSAVEKRFKGETLYSPTDIQRISQDLKDYDGKSFTASQLLDYAGLAASYGSVDLLNLVKVRMYYSVTSLVPDKEYDKGNFIRAQRDAYRNAAFACRKRHDLIMEKYAEEMSKDTPIAKEYAWGYWNNEFLDTDRGQVLTSKPDELKIAKTQFQNAERYYATYAVIEESLKQGKKYDLVPKQIKELKINKDVVDLSLNMQYAIKELLKIEGLDPKWLSVWYHVRPQREVFPQAYRAAVTFAEYVASRLGVGLEQVAEVMELEKYRAKEKVA